MKTTGRNERTGEDRSENSLGLQADLRNIHVQGLLSLGSFVLGAVAHHGAALCQVEVERDKRAVLHAQCTQGGTIDLGDKRAQLLIL